MNYPARAPPHPTTTIEKQIHHWPRRSDRTSGGCVSI